MDDDARMREQLRAGTSRSPVRWLAVTALVAVLVTVAFLGGAFVQAGAKWFEEQTGDAAVSRIESGPAVVAAVRRLANLETASYRMERVIKLSDTQRRLLGYLETKDEILLVAAADVTAGLDLSQLTDDDVRVDDERKSVRLTLPPPRVLTTRLDTERTYVHSRDTDLLARRNEQLESRARREAETSLTKAAQEAGILEHARRNAETTLGALLESLGFDDVTIEWR